VNTPHIPNDPEWGPEHDNDNSDEKDWLAWLDMPVIPILVVIAFVLAGYYVCRLQNQINTTNKTEAVSQDASLTTTNYLK
jgi:hypothetical protein